LVIGETGMRLLSIFCPIILMLMCGAVCRVFAEAPKTPKILFTSLRDGNREVYMMNPDGSEQVNLTQHRATDLQAVWSPSGEQILFVSDRQGTRVRDLYLMDPDGSNVRRVFKRKITAWRGGATWSPDGNQQFAYIYMDRIRIEVRLYIGTLGEEDSEHIGDVSFPDWSPDGSEIACTVGGRLTLLNVRTREQTRVLPKRAAIWQRTPSWSAVGDKLAFVYNPHPMPPVVAPQAVWDAWQAKQTIYIVNRDGTDFRQLIEEAGPQAVDPVLSPNGAEVLYTQEINGQPQIFKLNINSGIRTQLTHVGWNTGGDWFDPVYALPVSPQPELLTTTWGQQKKE
jgi:Tol biopolymer transport system component